MSSKGACSSLLPHLMLLKTKLLEPILQVKKHLKLQLGLSEIFFWTAISYVPCISLCKALNGLL